MPRRMPITAMTILDSFLPEPFGAGADVDGDGDCDSDCDGDGNGDWDCEGTGAPAGGNDDPTEIRGELVGACASARVALPDVSPLVLAVAGSAKVVPPPRPDDGEVVGVGPVLSLGGGLVV